MVSMSILYPGHGICSVWPRNPMGHNEDVVVSVRGVFVISDMKIFFWQYISMSFSQLSRRVLKP